MKLQVLLVSYLTTLNCSTCVDGTNEKISSIVDDVNNKTSPQVNGKDDEISTNLQRRSSEGYDLPYVGDVRFPMYSGKEIVIEGVIPQFAMLFNIYLLQTVTLTKNKPMDLLIDLFAFSQGRSSKHISPSFKQVDGSTLLFKGGEHFKMEIIITSIDFKIYVDGKMFGTYQNKMPIETIKYIKVQHQVDVDWILFSKMNPDPLEKIVRRRGGEKVVIYGYPTSKSAGFALNIICLLDGSGDIVTHLNPRFNHGGLIRKTLTNYFQKGQWADAAIYDYFDFELEKQFIVEFLTTPGSTEIKINSNFVKRLNHKMNCYDHVQFSGDVRVDKILMS